MKIIGHDMKIKYKVVKSLNLLNKILNSNFMNEIVDR